MLDKLDRPSTEPLYSIGNRMGEEARSLNFFLILTLNIKRLFSQHKYVLIFGKQVLKLHIWQRYIRNRKFLCLFLSSLRLTVPRLGF